VVLSIAILAHQELKSVEHLAEKKKQAVEERVEVIPGSNTCDAALALSTTLTTSHLPKA